MTPHDLRDTHVAWLIEAGWQEHKIVRRLGWKDGRMLHTVYGHLFESHDVADLQRLESWESSESTASNVVAFPS